MLLRFTKMHGLGNDFIVFEAPSEGSIPRPEVIHQLADRRTGIGFDQALALMPPRAAGVDVFYRIFNADGSEVEQCGNGARCIASLVASKLGRSDVRMDSPGGGIAGAVREDGAVSLDMGVPDFNPAALPFDASREADIYPLRVGRKGSADRRRIDGQPARGVADADRTACARGHAGARHRESFPLSEAHERGIHGGRKS